MQSIEYRHTQLRDLRVVTHRKTEHARETATAIEVNGDLLHPTNRFWRSLFHRFGLSDHVFRYFRYEEVLQRVVDANPDDRLRLCIERRTSGNSGSRKAAVAAKGERHGESSDGGDDRAPHGSGKLLAVSNPKRPLLDYEQTMRLISKYGDEKPTCVNGVVSSWHVPRSGEHGFDIGPDKFRNRFVVEVPIDGFGQPRIYLSLLRQVCSNGAVGYTRAFRSDIRIGTDAVYTLERAMGQFDHDEGFAALRQRFESAQRSWASVQETLTLQKTLARMRSESKLEGGLIGRLNQVAGDLHATYGLANLDSLSVKRQRVLPARCRVYDLINFASEVATHRVTAEGQSRLQAYIGTLISDEYDLEGTAEKVPEFKDLFLNLN